MDSASARNPGRITARPTFLRVVGWLVLWALGASTAMAGETFMPVDPAGPNVVRFEPVPAKFVRFVIHQGSASQPCLDELEVNAPDNDDNLALRSAGANASASSVLAGHAIHKIEHLNDGQYGNDHSWIASAESGWAQIELPAATTVDRVVFSRDRKSQFSDRVPVAFEIRISMDGRTWNTVRQVRASNLVVLETRPLYANRPIGLDLPPVQAKFVRLVIRKTNTGAEPCVDELEVYGTDPKRNLALASAGGKASASSCLEGYAVHKIEHLNDGQLCNAHSWIAASPTGWAQIELPEPVEIRRVVFSRDRGGSYRGRLPTEFEIRLSRDGKQWYTIKKVVAMKGGRIDRPRTGESPPDWAWRVAEALPAALREAAEPLIADVKSEADVIALLDLHHLDRDRQSMLKRLSLEFQPEAIRRAAADLSATFGKAYRPPADLHRTLSVYEKRLPELKKRMAEGDMAEIRQAVAECEAIFAFQRAVLLANPLLDFEEILLLRRKTPDTSRTDVYWQWGQKYGMTVNWSCDFRPKNPPVAPWWEESVVACSLPEGGRPLRTIFDAEPTHMIQHPELHFDAQRMLFAMPGPSGAFQVFEVNIDGTGLRQVTADTGADIDNGDPCYLSDGRIIFNSTRMYTGVPCEDGQSYVSNLCTTDASGRNTRILTFDQESNWYPTLLNNGRVLYTRYEYANISHQFGRLLFHMNPDGTGQMEYYGSNSYWPNSIFYARPIPNHPTMVAGVVCGHHGPNRTGRLVLFDPARGRHETSGAVQTIPGYGKPVERIVADELYGGDWPKFVHPWPLSEKYFLVSARIHPEQVEYGVYLVDVFDNITEVCRVSDFSLLEPIPLKPRRRPPAIPDRITPGDKEATVYLADVYKGPGLKGVPRGKVKRLRLFSYSYMYRDTIRRGFGHLATVGVDGPWEPRFILGTVPVDQHGAALFRVPANVPISVQPLDENGRALQLMRSWFTAMPGEVLSCVGCHDKQNGSPPSAGSIAAMGRPKNIEPWRGLPRGFDFELEVQPVLDKHCVGCHDGSEAERPDFARKTEEEKLRINSEYHRATESGIVTTFTPAFIAL
ncbi:MAG: discoidin domain-containing protein, partial [Candidatus Nealsonbacteria bacterium]|nr:discoidin domain-containing protein [Candidatus Nealsonbacteria bacterium]